MDGSYQDAGSTMDQWYSNHHANNTESLDPSHATRPQARMSLNDLYKSRSQQASTFSIPRNGLSSATSLQEMSEMSAGGRQGRNKDLFNKSEFKSRRANLGNPKKRHSDLDIIHGNKKKHHSAQITANRKRRKSRRKSKTRRAKNKLARSASMDDRDPVDPQKQRVLKNRTNGKRHTTTNIGNKRASGVNKRRRRKRIPKSENLISQGQPTENGMEPLEISSVNSHSSKKVRFRVNSEKKQSKNATDISVDDFIGDIKINVGTYKNDNNNKSHLNRQSMPNISINLGRNNSNGNNTNITNRTTKTMSMVSPPSGIKVNLSVDDIDDGGSINGNNSDRDDIDERESRFGNIKVSKIGITPTTSMHQQTSIDSPDTDTTYTQSIPPQPKDFSLKLQINPAGSDSGTTSKITMIALR